MFDSFEWFITLFFMGKNIKISEFYQEIYDLVNLIPYGRVTSYGAIAKALGRPGASRQVGYALTYSNKVGVEIPAHRVVNRVGALSGAAHFDTNNPMAKRLESEGIKVKEGVVQNFSHHFWDPVELAG